MTILEPVQVLLQVLCLDVRYYSVSNLGVHQVQSQSRAEQRRGEERRREDREDMVMLDNLTEKMVNLKILGFMDHVCLNRGFKLRFGQKCRPLTVTKEIGIYIL